MAVGGECVRWRRESSCGETLGGVSSERQSVGCRDVFRDAWATRSEKRGGGIGIRWQRRALRVRAGVAVGYRSSSRNGRGADLSFIFIPLRNLQAMLTGEEQTVCFRCI